MRRKNSKIKFSAKFDILKTAFCWYFAIQAKMFDRFIKKES